MSTVTHSINSSNWLANHAERRAQGAPPADWSPTWTVASRATLVLADVLALGVSLTLVALAGRLLFGADLPPLHWELFSAIGTWFLFRWALHGYRFGYQPPEELSNAFRASFIAFLVHLSILITSEDLANYRLLTLFLWFSPVPFTYSFREFFRSRLIAAGRYGVPVAMIGNGIAARRALRELKAQPSLGYFPVALFSSEKTRAGEMREVLGVPIVGRSEEAQNYRFPYPVRHAFLAVGAHWDDERTYQLAQQLGRRFPDLQIFTNLVGAGHWLSEARPLGPYLSIHTRNTRLNWHQRLLKRSLDIAISLPLLLVSAPILVVAGIAILIVDPGPVFFSQIREGRSGKPIRIYKLRSMVRDAEAKLAQQLAESPDAQFEYERTMKLRNDTRILPLVGRLIRRTSIDELPQLWSILKGDMSLVGPRVMPTREVDLYSEEGRELRRDVPPGLTGFWQVEHRSDSDFQVREIADSFYVGNWSVWLDLWIILRTVRVVLTGSGAV